MKEPEDDILKQFGLEDDELLRQALSGLEKMEVKPVLSKEEAWTKFEQSLVMKGNFKTKHRITYFGFVWRIAASVLVLIAVWLGFNAWNRVSYTTANNQMKEIILPDRSTVTLNAASSLSFHKTGWKSSRKVTLKGEALFKIVKGNTFEISTLGKTIKVLGTEFNVFSRENYFEVKCISGRVEVRIPGSGKTILTKGNAIKKVSGSTSPDKFEVSANVASWIKGDFYYEGADLNLVFDELGRQYNVRILKDTSIHRLYSGYFNKSSLTEALNNVCLPMGLHYRISKDSVIIEKGF